MSKAWAKGSTRRWRQARAAVLLANAHTNGGRCQLALGTWTTRDGQQRSCEGVATEVHHVKGKASGDERDNLMAVCGPCNRRVGQPKSNSGQHKRVSNW